MHMNSDSAAIIYDIQNSKDLLIPDFSVVKINHRLTKGLAKGFFFGGVLNSND